MGSGGLDRLRLVAAVLVLAVWLLFQVARLVDPSRPDVPVSVTIPMGAVTGFLFGGPLVRRFHNKTENGNGNGG